MRYILASAALLAVASLATAQEQQSCYWPNGSRDSSSTPCGNGGSAIVPCCYSNHYCLDNGLCWAKSSNTMYRGSCTDPEFKSDNCGQFCLGDNGWGAANSHSGVWTCDDGKFACHSSPLACSQFNFTVGGGKLLYNQALAQDVGDDLLLPSGSASGVVATVTTTVTQTPTGGSGEEGSSGGDGGISTAAAAGIGAGVGVPLFLAVLTLLFFLFRERKKRQAYENQLSQLGMQANGQNGGLGVGQYQAVPAHAAEMTPQGTSPNPAELKGSQRYELYT